LRVAVSLGELDAVKELIAAGIEINEVVSISTLSEVQIFRINCT